TLYDPRLQRLTLVREQEDVAGVSDERLLVQLDAVKPTIGLARHRLGGTLTRPLFFQKRDAEVKEPAHRFLVRSLNGHENGVVPVGRDLEPEGHPAAGQLVDQLRPRRLEFLLAVGDETKEAPAAVAVMDVAAD